MSQNEQFEGTVEFTTNIGKRGCAVGCKICPQELLTKSYVNAHVPSWRNDFLSFDDFVTILDKVPKTYRIDFSGYAEPFLNKECARMIKYAYTSGYSVCCYTTLVGASLDDVDLLSSISFSPLCPLTIHLPDKNGLMPIKVTEKYKNILKYLISKNIASAYFMTMDGMGEPHQDVQDLVGKLPNFMPISRASNLDNVDKVDRVRGKIQCNPMPKLNHNIVLPNGDVQLCCMDYGLKHTLGNLITDSHESLFQGKEFIKIKNAMKNDSDDILCRFCEMAEPII
jgi:hypothetical protein